MVTTWERFETWDLVLPPSRPSASHLQFAREAMRDADRSKPAAVLGSTPEFRDLLFEMGFEDVQVLDSNCGFYEQMSKLRVYRDTDHLVQGDWLETLSQCAGRFSVILSDLTMGNVPYDARKTFYSLITDSLALGGKFIDKVLTHPGEMLKAKDLVEKYEKAALNLLSLNYFSCEFLFCSELLDIRGVVDTSMFYDRLERDLSHPRLRAFLGRCTEITPRDCIWYYGKKWSELEASYCPRLETVRTTDDDEGSPYYGRLKMFYHRKGRG